MKNDDIVTMMRSGITAVSSHGLSLDSAYTVTSFKREIERLFNEWNIKNNKLSEEVDITDPVSFDKRIEELRGKEELSKEEKKELSSMEDKLSRLTGLRLKLLEDTVEIKCKAMPYEEWYKFKDENSGIKINNFEMFELIELKLENILWKAPQE